MKQWKNIFDVCIVYCDALRQGSRIPSVGASQAGASTF